MQPFSDPRRTNPIPTDVPVGAVLLADASRPQAVARNRYLVSCPHPGVQSSLPEQKYNRSAMENWRQLQCKSLREQEKFRRRKNNGEQWKNNARSNGNNEKSGR